MYSKIYASAKRKLRSWSGQEILLTVHGKDVIVKRGASFSLTGTLKSGLLEGGEGLDKMLRGLDSTKGDCCIVGWTGELRVELNMMNTV